MLYTNKKENSFELNVQSIRYEKNIILLSFVYIKEISNGNSIQKTVFHTL
jgi:hypothetical protein